MRRGSAQTGAASRSSLCSAGRGDLALRRSGQEIGGADAGAALGERRDGRLAVWLRVPDATRGPDAAVSPPPSPTSTPATPASVPTSPLLKEPVADRSDSVATVRPMNPTPDDAQTAAPPPSKREAVTTTTAPSNIPDGVPAPGCAVASVTEAGQSRAQAVTDCVVGWLKGEVQEFRDGAARDR